MDFFHIEPYGFFHIEPYGFFHIELQWSRVLTWIETWYRLKSPTHIIQYELFNIEWY